MCLLMPTSKSGPQRNLNDLKATSGLRSQPSSGPQWVRGHARWVTGKVGVNITRKGDGGSKECLTKGTPPGTKPHEKEVPKGLKLVVLSDYAVVVRMGSGGRGDHKGGYVAVVRRWPAGVGMNSGRGLGPRRRWPRRAVGLGT
jgi:hypothetical protein